MHLVEKVSSEVVVRQDLVIFTIINNELSVALDPDSDHMELPSIRWTGGDLNSNVSSLTEKFAPTCLMNPVFSTLQALKLDGAVLSLGYFLCAAPSDLGSINRFLSYKNRHAEMPRGYHRELIFRAYEKLTQSTARPYIAAMLDDGFTLAQLQDATTIVRGDDLDKRHFRRQVEETGWLEYTGEKLMGAHRPAMKYVLSDSVVDRPRYRRRLSTS